MPSSATALIALIACLALPATAHGAEAWLRAEPLSAVKADERPRRDVRRHDAGRGDGADRARPRGARHRLQAGRRAVPPRGRGPRQAQAGNVVRVKRVRKRKLARGSYRATITPKTGDRTLAPVKLRFKIRR